MNSIIGKEFIHKETGKNITIFSRARIISSPDGGKYYVLLYEGDNGECGSISTDDIRENFKEKTAYHKSKSKLNI